MAEHQLNRPQIRATLQQMRGKTVSQHVRSQRNAQPRLLSIVRENLPHAHAADLYAPPVHKQKTGRLDRLRAARAVIPAGRRANTARQSPALFSPPAPPFLYHLFPMHRTHPTFASRSLTFSPVNSDTRNPVEYKTSSIARSRKPCGRAAVRLFQQAFDFFQPQISRQRFPNLRRFQVRRRIIRYRIVDLREAEKNSAATPDFAQLFCSPAFAGRALPENPPSRPAKLFRVPAFRFFAKSSNFAKSRLYAEYVFTERPFSTFTCG